MANHPRRNWRKQWTVDLEARVARHETTGAVFEFGATADPSGGLVPSTLDPAGLLPPSSTLRNRFEVVRELTTKHGAAAAAQMVQSLQRDAIDVYQRTRSRGR